MGNHRPSDSPKQRRKDFCHVVVAFQNRINPRGREKLKAARDVVPGDAALRGFFQNRLKLLDGRPLEQRRRGDAQWHGDAQRGANSGEHVVPFSRRANCGRVKADETKLEANNPIGARSAGEVGWGRDRVFAILLTFCEGLLNASYCTNLGGGRTLYSKGFV